jgi:hypothetical protein
VYALVPAFAVLTTWLSGLIEISSYEYGFPLPWKTMVFGRPVCPPSPLESACFLVYGLTVYNWNFFIFDSVFYAALSYATIFGSHAVMVKLFRHKTLRVPNRQVGFESV